MEYGENAQKESMASWLAAYRFLFKSSPCIPEVAIRLAQLSEFERSYTHVLLYPPQPVAMVGYDGRPGNFSAKMYGASSSRLPMSTLDHADGDLSLTAHCSGRQGLPLLCSLLRNR